MPTHSIAGGLEHRQNQAERQRLHQLGHDVEPGQGGLSRREIPNPRQRGDRQHGRDADRERDHARHIRHLNLAEHFPVGLPPPRKDDQIQCCGERQERHDQGHDDGSRILHVKSGRADSREETHFSGMRPRRQPPQRNTGRQRTHSNQGQPTSRSLCDAQDPLRLGGL